MQTNLPAIVWATAVLKTVALALLLAGCGSVLMPEAQSVICYSGGAEVFRATGPDLRVLVSGRLVSLAKGGRNLADTTADCVIFFAGNDNDR